ncbi:unnamed protein product [Gongylonema pulchrum]|uniref:Uncharacterized protein n=1 Tax=Gongylonema pulchrum TaxID=637853 RepID=A0A183DA82_9BILA|nr:unnamed protein product [Gongylonema pulchrum]
MRLKKLKLSGSMTENGDMDVAVSLGVFIMDDERRERTRVRRLLDKKVMMHLIVFFFQLSQVISANFDCTYGIT